MSTRWWAAITLGAVALSACSSVSAGPARSTDGSTSASLSYAAPVEGMTAWAYRTRVDDAEGGRFQIKLTNTGDEEFTVVSTGLDSPGFQPVPPSPRKTEFRPGARIDMPTPYGSVRCGSEDVAEPAYAALDIVRPDGGQERVRVPLPSDHSVLTRIHDEECQVLELAAAVTVELVDLHTVGSGADQVAQGSLRLTRRESDSAIAVTDLRGNVLYDVVPQPGTSLPVTLADDQTAVALPLEVSPATCAAHVIAETKKPFVFPLWVTVGSAEPVFTEIPVSAAQRDLLYASLTVACGL